MSINIYVGNLSFDSSEDDLRACLKHTGSKFGQDHRRPIYQPIPRFGFIEMENREEGLKAIQSLDSKDLGGRALKVNEARPRPVPVAVVAADDETREAAHAGNSPVGVSFELRTGRGSHPRTRPVHS